MVYTLDVLFKHVLSINYSLHTEEEIFRKENSGVKINYSATPIKNSIQIVPSSLLFQSDISVQEINIDWVNKLPYFFKTSEEEIVNYDIFSTIFFMVSRYEEYLPTELDQHGRFKAENTLAFKNGFLEIPVVNLWIKEFQQIIETAYPLFQFTIKKYNYINSVDIDIAYSYKGKSKFILISSIIKSVLEGDTLELKNKYNYFIKGAPDPYDTYDYIEELKRKYNSKNLYFIQVGNYGKFDKNLSHKSTKFIALIKKLHRNNTVGIHPSYNSNQIKKLLPIEINRLEIILNEKITKSRKHFLKATFPTTFENLIALGIKEDYSLGFASKIGFRAGICNSYPFFNLSKNKATDLILHPFQVMDGTLNTYMNLNPEEAIHKINEIISAVKSVDGTFISLWHNSSLSELNEWKNWKKVYASLVENAKDS